MATTLQKIQDSANELYSVRQEIEQIENDRKVLLESLRIKRDAIQDKLLAMMAKNNVASLKVKNGDTFIKSSKKSIGITNEVFALNWAIKNMAVSINKTLVGHKLKEVDTIPKGFEIKTTEFISVRKAKIQDE